MRIAVIVNDFPSVSETFIINKVRLLAQRGHHLLVYCTNLNKQLWNEHFEKTANITPVVIDRRKSTRYALTHPFIALKGIKRLGEHLNWRLFADAINKTKPGIVHFEFSGIAVNLMPALKAIKSKKVISCRGTAEKVKLPIHKERQEKLKTAFDNVDAIHCVSEDMKLTVLPYCNRTEKIFVNYTGVDVNFFKRTASAPRRERLVISSVGRLTFQKGYLSGLLAIKRLKEATPNFQWMIMGDGPQKEELTFYIHQMELQQHVTLAGSKSKREVYTLLNDSDIFFLPSVSEGISNSALEAMSMELPVVSTRCGGMEEVITHNVNGLLADVYDSNTLFHHLFHLMHDKQLRRELGKAGRETIVNNFSLERHVKTFESCYQSLLKKN